MKNIIIAVTLMISGVFSASAAQSHVLEFEIKDGGHNLSTNVKRTMERNLVKLMTRLSDAQSAGRKNLDFSDIKITPTAQGVIRQLWRHQAVRVWTDDETVAPFIEEELLNITNAKTYQIRNIPVRLYDRDAPGVGKYSEVAITFSPDGAIVDFNIAIKKQQYNKMLEGARTVADVENRKMIAAWMDELQMAYVSKNLEYLKSLFDPDAIIITGVRTSKRTGVETKFKTQENFNYHVKTREQYLQSLKKIFKINKQIRLQFLDQEYGYNASEIIKDKYGVEMPRYYCVWCTQEWNATNYKDVGNLFVLWDFKDPEHPVILARVWTRLDDNKRFSFEDFELK